MFLTGLMKIGQIALKNLNMLVGLVKADDDDLNTIKAMTCRIWVGRACERLRERGLLSYPGWDVLQQEASESGRANWADSEQNMQPRPLIQSEVCLL